MPNDHLQTRPPITKYHVQAAPLLDGELRWIISADVNLAELKSLLETLSHIYYKLVP